MVGLSGAALYNHPMQVETECLSLPFGLEGFGSHLCSLCKLFSQYLGMTNHLHLSYHAMTLSQSH